MTPERALAEERRLFYVAMTRARDELLLCHAADYGGSRARRVSPFVLEALDLPATDATPGAGAVTPTAEERLARFAAVDVPVPARTARRDEPLMLSFGQVDAYLSCPLRYKYAHVLRIPVPPHHALIYGSALHKVVQVFHHRHARGHIMSEAELDEVLDSAWSNEGFVSREHEEARLEAARAALRRFREEQLQPDAVIPTYVEREFAFDIDGDRVRGRWDRVDIESVTDGDAVEPRGALTRPAADVVTPTLGIMGRERVTITDYKTSDVRDPAKAQPARARVAPAPDLRDGLRGDDRPAARPGRAPFPRLGPRRQGRRRPEAGRQGARTDRGGRQLASGRRRFDATPEPMVCTRCPFRDICPSSVARPR